MSPATHVDLQSPDPLARPAPRPMYIDGVFGFYHAPSGPLMDTAVMIVPPFGWDDVCSYRGRRAWAEQLSATGHPTLRFDLPGSGDSDGSPTDPGRLEAWVGAAAAAAAWLRTDTGVTRVVAIGLGLGGMVAIQAAAEGAPIDDLVLWAVPARGRALIRELRAFANLKAAEHGLPEGGDAEVFHAAGYVLSDESLEALQKLDLTALALPAAASRRTLLLEREGIAVDPRLRDHLELCGAEVTVAPGDGYTAMMAHPQESRPPVEVFATVAAWLAQASDVQTPVAGTHSRQGRGALELIGGAVRETPLFVDQPFGRLFGILAEPVGRPREDICVAFLNPGAVRRIGPNRMWVETARRWAARGVPSLRLDLEALGDADGDESRYEKVDALYVPELVTQVSAALDVLGSRGLPRRVVLVGLCSGAYWAFHAALCDDRVRAAFMLNARALFWDPTIETARDARKLRDLMRGASWRKILRGEVSSRRIRAFVRWVLLAPTRVTARDRGPRARSRELDRALDSLREMDKRLLMVFSGREPMHGEFEREGRLERLDRWPNVEVEVTPGADHTFRPLMLQRHVNGLLDRALDSELASLRRDEGPRP